jgi:dTDP-4-dehydrorhamnose reductase
MRRALILGGLGMLGHKLCQQWSRSGWSVTATFRGEYDPRPRYPGVFDGCDVVTGLNVLDSAAVKATLADVRPDVVVNCAGIVKQRPEAHDRYQSIAVNALLPHQLARYCGEIESRLIHISTDCVFDGGKGRYVETDACTAADLYGQTKALGETDSTESAAVTLRTSIIGRELSESGHGLLEWFLRQRGRHVRGFTRAIFSGLTTPELSRVIANVAEHHPDLTGVYHVAAEPISKHDLLQVINTTFGAEIPITAESEFACDRSLDGSRFRAATGYLAPDWPTLIAELVRDETPYDDWHDSARLIAERWGTHSFKSC